MNKAVVNCSFSEMTLDRVSNLRKDNEWLLTQLTKDNCLIIPVWRSHFLFAENELFMLKGEDKFNVLTPQFSPKQKGYHLVFLGMSEAQPIFAIDISSVDENDITPLFNQHLNVVSLRSTLSLLSDEQASILGFANNILHWNKTNLFCGVCGSATQMNNGGHSISCTNSECKKEIFPRTDPVVIMLVEYKPENGPVQCLLAEHDRSPEKCASTLAGFVDPAETLEQGVVREVKEEVGVDVVDVEYVKSQPWPFPSSLMLGFYAKTNDPTIKIDDDEIRDAKWFTADEVRAFSNWGDEDENYKIPRKGSIARYLIDTWLEKNK